MAKTKKGHGNGVFDLVKEGASAPLTSLVGSLAKLLPIYRHLRHILLKTASKLTNKATTIKRIALYR